MQILHTFYFVGLIALSAELPVIQLEYRSVINKDGIFAEILMNGVSVTPSGDGRIAFDLMTSVNDSASLHDALWISMNRFNNTENDTYQRCQECSFNGHQLMHVSDQIMHNGKDFLFLDATTDTWTALDPQAFSLKEEFNRNHERNVEDRMRLQEACTELLKKLCFSQTAPRISAAVLTPVLAGLVLFGLVLVSFILSKHGGVKGSVQPAGGVLGSIVHYPAPTSDIREPAKQPSHSIKASLLANMP